MNLAKIAYDAYCESTGGVSLVTGDKLPVFYKLKSSIQKAWQDAATAVGIAVTLDSELRKELE